jgi:flagellar basal-body rod protein FlgC
LYEPEIIAWLRSKDVRVEKDPDGDERVFDSPGCRRALVQYRRMLRLRLDVIAQNVLNANTTRDARGERNPYRRRLVADKNGSIEITTDPSPFQKRYDPGHPDADRDGYVLYPNVDKEIERVNGLEASREYDGVTRVLKHFDPTFAGN